MLLTSSFLSPLFQFVASAVGRSFPTADFGITLVVEWIRVSDFSLHLRGLLRHHRKPGDHGPREFCAFTLPFAVGQFGHCRVPHRDAGCGCAGEG